MINLAYNEKDAKRDFSVAFVGKYIKRVWNGKC